MADSIQGRFAALPTFEYGTAAIMAGARMGEARSLGTVDYAFADHASSEEAARTSASLRWALNQAERFVPGSKPRMLRVPGLQVFAVWAPSHGDSHGRIFPLRPVPRFLKNDEYDQNEFEEILRKRLLRIRRENAEGYNDIAP